MADIGTSRHSDEFKRDAVQQVSEALVRVGGTPDAYELMRRLSVSVRV